MRAHYDLVIAGGGAAGFFAAIHYSHFHPGKHVVILEKSSKILSKVKISGGGRCNVTNACSDLSDFLSHYPRGEKELRQVLTQFSNHDTVRWFESQGVRLKTEADGRIFPTTDNSQTIIDCLLDACEKYGITIATNCGLHHYLRENDQWQIVTNQGEFSAAQLLIATGGNTSKNIYALLENSGHHIIPEVPSLFTFNIKDKALHALQGLSVGTATANIEGTRLHSEGPVLITHWGLSGPCILKLSAKAARVLHEKNYDFVVNINWINAENMETAFDEMQDAVRKITTKQLQFAPAYLSHIPKRLWMYFLEKCHIDAEKQWAQIKKEELRNLASHLYKDQYAVFGKTTFKEEFVTAGGISLKDIDMKTMQSKKSPGLYFAGEVIDVDGLTGGFNFQAAWSTAYVAARSMH